MKKLMIAAVAMAASVAMADVTSANIVGFAQSELVAGYGATTTQFVLPSNIDKFDLAATKIIGKGVDWNVYASLINADGSTGYTYTWTDDDGWVDGGMEPITGEGKDATFLSGSAFYYQNDSGATIAFQSAGQVGAKDVEFKVSGYSAFGNPFPVEVALQDIAVTGDGVDWNVYASLINADGSTGYTYTWTNDDGWVDGGMNKVPDDFKISAGDSFYVQADVAATITIPAPVL